MVKRKFKWKKWLLVMAGILAAVVIVAFIGFTWFMNKSKPVIDGELAVEILDQHIGAFFIVFPFRVGHSNHSFFFLSYRLSYRINRKK